MKLITLSERAKHRIIGLAVLVSIAALFAPAILKKSNRHFDRSMDISVKLPTKPLPPQITIPEEEKMFQTRQVARVEIKPDEKIAELKTKMESAATLTPAAQLADNKDAELKAKLSVEPKNILDSAPKLKAEKAADLELKAAAKKAQTLSRITPKVEIAKTSAVKVNWRAAQQKSQLAASRQSARIAVSRNLAFKSTVKTALSTKIANGYAIQLALFSEKKNADALIARLRARGYVATVEKLYGRNGLRYKVTVGQLRQREEAKGLQKKLATNLRLNGFIVETRIG